MDILSLGLLAGAAYLLLRKGPDIQADPTGQDTAPEIADEAGYIPQNGSAGSVTMPTFPPVSSYQEAPVTQIIQTPNVAVVVPPNTPAKVVEQVAEHNAQPGLSSKIYEIPEVNTVEDLAKYEVQQVYGASVETAQEVLTRFFDPVALMNEWNDAVTRYMNAWKTYFIRTYGTVSGMEYYAQHAKPYTIVSIQLIKPGWYMDNLGYWEAVTDREGVRSTNAVAGTGWLEMLATWKERAKQIESRIR